MSRILRPIPLEREIVLDPYRTIMSKTDKKGIIEFANDYFMEVCKYKEWELMAQPHNIIRHPDMPQIAFKILWDRLLSGQNIHAVVKNLAKDGSYYWVVTDFQNKYDENGNIIALYSRRKAIPHNVKYFFAQLYRKLIEIEEAGGMIASGAFLNSYLEEQDKSYDQLLLDLFQLNEKDFMSYMRAQISDEQLSGNMPMSAEQAIKKSKKKSFLTKIFS